MAKKGGKGKSTTMVSPLYESGTTNGPVGGPTGGIAPKDPLGYLSNSGQAAPGGSPSERTPTSKGERATAH